MIVAAAGNLLLALCITISVVPLLIIAWQAWWDGEEADVETMAWLNGLRRFVVVFIVFPTWVMTLAGSEEIIKLNGLTPQTDLSQPGQSIPFAIGIIVAVDGLAAAIKPGRKNN